MKNLIPYIAIIGLLIFLFNRECTRPGKVANRADTTVIRHIIPGDSIPYEVEIIKKVPVPVYVDTGSTRWRERPVDTNAILADYFSKYGYLDTLMNDTSAMIILKAHTFMNRLFYDDLFFQNKRVKQINTTIITPQAKEKMKLYPGIGVNFLPGNPGISGNMLLVTPEKLAVSTGYDFTNKMIQANLYYKIQFRKK